MLLVISTTTTTTVATRAPCGNNCACVVSPCPVVVIKNPCAPNPWFVVLIEFEEIFYACFSLTYSQNMGGCAVQNNAAKCWCAGGYQGYYCQFRMLK